MKLTDRVARLVKLCPADAASAPAPGRALPSADTLAQAWAQAARAQAQYDALPRLGRPRLQAYLKEAHETLPAEIQRMLGYDLPWWAQRIWPGFDINYLSRRMRWVFARCGCSGEKADPAQLRSDQRDYEDYVQKYRGQAAALWAQYQAAQKEVRELLAQCGADDEAEEAFRAQARALPEQTRAFLLYMLALREPSEGRSGAHFMGSGGGVFWPCSWAATEPVSGVAFGIRSASFAGYDPLLFFSGDKLPRGTPLAPFAEDTVHPWLRKVYGAIEGYSSGIRLEGMAGKAILFRLDAARVKPLDILYSLPKDVPQPDYVFTWPGAGEFQCTLGEVIDGKLFPLHWDDFVMK